MSSPAFAGASLARNLSSGLTRGRGSSGIEEGKVVGSKDRFISTIIRTFPVERLLDPRIREDDNMWILEPLRTTLRESC
jgi:hypothetical protein